jgi:hypothetical protein
VACSDQPVSRELSRKFWKQSSVTGEAKNFKEAPLGGYWEGKFKWVLVLSLRQERRRGFSPIVPEDAQKEV